MKSSYCFISKTPSKRCIGNSIYALCTTNSLGWYYMDKNGFWRNDLKSNSTINNWRQSEFFRSWYCSFAQNICYKVMSKKNNTIILLILISDIVIWFSKSILMDENISVLKYVNNANNKNWPPNLFFQMKKKCFT